MKTMKKIFLVMAMLITSISFAQISTTISAPTKASVSDSIVLVNSNKKATHLTVDELTSRIRGIPVHNATGGTLLSGKVVYPLGTSTLGVVNIDYAIANSHVTIEKQVGLLDGDILDGENGTVVLSGILNTDTSAYSVGSVYVSTTVAGDLTNTMPEFQDFVILMGVVTDVGVSGKIAIDIRDNINDAFADIYDGIIRETFNFRVTSNGTVVTGTFENVDNTRDLTAKFSDGLHVIDVTPAQTITLTAGTDSNTQTNYVFYPISTKTLTVSLSGFPVEEHCKVAVLEVQSASNVQSVGGARKNQNYNDHVKYEEGNGHLVHITSWIRRQFATWGDAGCEVTFDDTAGDGLLSMTSGVVDQLHPQSVEALSMPTIDVLIANDITTPFLETDNLNTITEFSDGSAWSNKWGKIVVWLIANKTGEPNFICVNLPRGGENDSGKALLDEKLKASYAIPTAYKSNAILLGAFSIKINAGVVTFDGDEQDLRGTIPSNIAGGGGSGGVSSFLGLDDTPSSYLGEAGKIYQVNVGETALETTDSPSLSIIDFIPRATTVHNEGRLFYDSNSNAMAYHNDISDLTVQIGQETIQRVFNDTGSTILNGTSCAFGGVNNQMTKIIKAQANGLVNSFVIGVATHDIPHNTEGFITTSGLVHDLNLGAFQNGDLLYLSPSVAGGYTTTRPTEWITLVGMVVYNHTSDGTFSVSIAPNVVHYIDQLEDVDLTGIATGQGLEWDGVKFVASVDVTDYVDTTVENNSWAQSFVANWRDFVLDDGAIYFPNNTAYEIGRDRQNDLSPSFMMIPSATKDGVLYNIKGSQNFTVNRNSIATYIGDDGLIYTAGVNEARFQNTALLLEPQATQLYELTDSMSTQVKTTAADDYVVSFYGTGTITFTGTHTGSLIGTGENERVEVTFLATAGSLTSTISGTVNNGQLQLGTVADSYIRNIGTGQVTRLADQITAGGTVNDFNSEAGTLFFECRKIDDSTISAFGINSNIDNRINFVFSNDNLIFEFIKSGSFSVPQFVQSFDKEIANKMAITWSVADLEVSFYLNGQLLITNAILISDFPSITKSSFSASASDFLFKGEALQEKVFKTTLTLEEIQKL